MKTTVWIGIVFLLLSAGCRKRDYRLAFVTKDCSGGYLVLEDKEYQVCNAEMLAPFLDYDRVEVQLEWLGQCTGPASSYRCSTVHLPDGWVRVESIKEAPGGNEH